MIAAGCDEIDVVMNIGMLKSGELDEVESDVRAVIDTSASITGESDHRDHVSHPE